MVKVICRTNLDLGFEELPTELPIVPRVGDWIRSNTIHQGGFRLTLEVYSVWLSQNEPPIVELHQLKFRGWSIKQFYDWYAPLIGKSPTYFY